MEKENLMTVVKQENLMEVDTTSDPNKVIVNITLRKPKIFEKTNSVFWNKKVRDSVKGVSQRSPAAENLKSNYPRSLNKSTTTPDLNFVFQHSLKKNVEDRDTSSRLDQNVSVKVEQNNDGTELLEDIKPPIVPQSLYEASDDQCLDAIEDAASRENISTVLLKFEVDEIQNLEVNDNSGKTLQKFIQEKRSLYRNPNAHSKINRGPKKLKPLLVHYCDQCNYKSKHKGHLNRHIKCKHLPRDPKANKCEKCKINFLKRSNLLAHSKICGQSEDQIDSLKRYVCDHCGYKTNMKNSLTVHIRGKHLPRNSNANKCEKCKTKFSWRSTLLAHSKICGQSEDKIDSLKRYICDHCDYRSAIKSQLVTHIRSKHLPRDHNVNICKKCEKSFAWRSNLLAHSKICGQSEDKINSLKRYVCDHCGYKTNLKNNLTVHIQAKHLPRDFSVNMCKKCKTKFSWRSTLLAHSKICGQSEDKIDSLKRYICDHCNYRSAVKSQLVTHIRSKHLPRDHNVNICKKCEKSFAWRSNLLAHSKICGQSEDKINSLKRYVCDHCGYKTNLKNNITVHIQAKHLPRDLSVKKCKK